MGTLPELVEILLITHQLYKPLRHAFATAVWHKKKDIIGHHRNLSNGLAATRASILHLFPIPTRYFRQLNANRQKNYVM
ncbi:MAG: hypothetical protein DMG10_27700 [Acidobacteria bacterium]|nr:MAG: hypothetical protein DMG10_27700 [Acidobacteriota bacterium]